MKNFVSYNQGNLIKIGAMKGIKVDSVDGTLFDWIKTFILSDKSMKNIIDNKIFMWVSYKAIREDNPICHISSNDVVGRRLQKLVDLGILEKHLSKEDGNKAFFCITSFAYTYLLEDRELPTQESEALPTQKSYNSKLIDSKLIEEEKIDKKEPHQTSSNTQNTTSSKYRIFDEEDFLPREDFEEVEVIDKNTDVQEIQISKTYDDAKEVADYLLAKILTVNPTFKRENKSWIRDIELAIRLDGRDKKSLMNCIDWMYSSDKGRFWIANVLSGKKLREKFDTMNTQAMSFTGTNGLGYDVNAFVEKLCGNK